MMKRVTDPSQVKPGDYVLCTRWSDRDPDDPWQVGFLDRVDVIGGDLLFRLRNPMRSYYKCCWHITKEQGDRII